MSGTIVLGLRVLLALALYAFLGWAFWTIWQDLKQTGIQVATRKIPPIRIEVRTRERAPVSRVFTQAEILLGRDPACDIRLEDGAVSARHAKLSYHHSQWWIEDMDSTNGTVLNRQKLTTATVITNGDEIKCGKVQLRITLVGPMISQVTERIEI